MPIKPLTTERKKDMQNKNSNEKQQEKPNNNVTTERIMFIAKTVKSICEAENSNKKRQELPNILYRQ